MWECRSTSKTGKPSCAMPRPHSIISPWRIRKKLRFSRSSRASRMRSSKAEGDEHCTREEVVAAFRPPAPYTAEDELRHWERGGLKQGLDGRCTRMVAILQAGQWQEL